MATTTPHPSTAPPVEGVSLEQYAGVSAAVIEGFALPAVLSAEGLDERAWPRVSLRWSQRLADGGAASPLSTSYRDTLAFARGWLGRRVAPLEEDLAVWFAFLNAWSAHPAPFDLLKELAILPADVTRIQGAWAQKIEKDQELRKKAQELARKKPSAVPRVKVTPAVLRPFPWSNKRVAHAEELSLVKPKLSSSFIGDAFGLERYAALAAELGAAQKGDAAAVLARQALDEASFAEMTARWERRFTADPTLKQDFVRLRRYYEAKAKASQAKRQEAPVPVRVEIEMPVVLPRSPLAGTALALDIPRGPALPFVVGEAPEEIALPEAEVVEIDDEGREKPAANAPNKLAGTSLALDVPKGPALPFAARVQVKSKEASVAAEGAWRAEAALTLERHASMTVEIAMSPEKALEVLARYGLTVEGKRAVDAYWRGQVERDAGVREAWQRAYGVYWEWVVKAGRG